MTSVAGFFEIMSPTLLDRLGIVRVDRDRQAQKKEAIKKLQSIGVNTHVVDKLVLIKEEELNNRLEEIFKSNTTSTSYEGKTNLSKDILDNY